MAPEELDDEARAARAAMPDARRPDRRRTVSSHGLRLAVYEWGDVNAPPILLVHGGMDFAGTWDLLAPLLADGGWRAVAFDQRGHGDSEHAALYSWDADVREALAVPEGVPMIYTDARERLSTKNALLVLVRHALMQATS